MESYGNDRFLSQEGYASIDFTLLDRPSTSVASAPEFTAPLLPDSSFPSLDFLDGSGIDSLGGVLRNAEEAHFHSHGRHKDMDWRKEKALHASSANMYIQGGENPEPELSSSQHHIPAPHGNFFSAKQSGSDNLQGQLSLSGNRVGDQVHDFFEQEHLSQQQSQLDKANWSVMNNNAWPDDSQNKKSRHIPQSSYNTEPNKQPDEGRHSSRMALGVRSPQEGPNNNVMKSVSRNQPLIFDSLVNGSSAGHIRSNQGNSAGDGGTPEQNQSSTGSLAGPDIQQGHIVGRGSNHSRNSSEGVENVEARVNYDFLGSQLLLKGQLQAGPQFHGTTLQPGSEEQLLKQFSYQKHLQELQRQQQIQQLEQHAQQQQAQQLEQQARQAQSQQLGQQARQAQAQLLEQQVRRQQVQQFMQQARLQQFQQLEQQGRLQQFQQLEHQARQQQAQQLEHEARQQQAQRLEQHARQQLEHEARQQQAQQQQAQQLEQQHARQQLEHEARQQQAQQQQAQRLEQHARQQLEHEARQQQAQQQQAQQLEQQHARQQLEHEARQQRAQRLEQHALQQLEHEARQQQAQQLEHEARQQLEHEARQQQAQQQQVQQLEQHARQQQAQQQARQLQSQQLGQQARQAQAQLLEQQVRRQQVQQFMHQGRQQQAQQLEHQGRQQQAQQLQQQARQQQAQQLEYARQQQTQQQAQQLSMLDSSKPSSKPSS